MAVNTPAALMIVAHYKPWISYTNSANTLLHY